MTTNVLQFNVAWLAQYCSSYHREALTFFCQEPYSKSFFPDALTKNVQGCIFYPHHGVLLLLLLYKPYELLGGGANLTKKTQTE